MADAATVLAILNGANNAPPPPGAGAGGMQQPPPSQADSVLSILQQGAAGNFKPANTPGSVPMAADGAPGSAFTSDPNLPGAELRPMQAMGNGGPATGLPAPVVSRGGFRGSGGALRPGGAAGSPSRSFGERAPVFLQGANEGIAGTLGMPVDLVAAGLNAGSRGINSLTGYDLGQISNPLGGSQSFNDLFSKIGAVDPNFQPRDAADTALLAGGRGVGQTATMLPMMAAMLKSAGAAALSGVTGGEGQEGGHQLAGLLAPGVPEVDSVLSTAGGLLGGFAPAGIMAGAKAPFAAYRALRAPTTAPYQENMAGRILRDASTYGTPDTLQGSPLPGNPISLGRAANDPGLMAMENQLNRASNAAEGDALASQTVGNQVTRRGLQSISPGDPNAVAPAIQSRNAAIDSTLDVGATAALRRVQQAMDDAGLGQGSDRTGASLEARTELESSLKGARQVERDTWGKIDPEGTLNISTGGLKSDLNSYVAGVPKLDRAELPQDVIDQIKGLDTAEPMSEWTAIPKALGAKMREAQSAGQWNRARMIGELKDVVLNRLNNLTNDDFMPATGAPSTVAVRSAAPGQSLIQFLAGRGGIKDTGGDLTAMDLHLWHRGAAFRNKLVNPQGFDLDYAREAAVEAGYLPEGSTTNDLLQALAKDARGPRVYPGGANASDGYDPGAAADHLQTWQDQQGGGQQIAAAVDRYKQAVDYSRNFNQLFSRGAVRQTLKVAPGGGPSVQPSQTLAGITKTPEGISQFLQATKQSPEAIGAVRDYLLRDLETKAVAPNGSLKADALRAWVAKNGASLDEIDSTLRGRLTNAATQQDALEQVLASNEASKAGMQADAAQRFLGSDPQKAVGQILGARDNGRSLGQLLEGVRGKPDALEGTRAALLDWILDKASTRGADLRGDALLNSGALDDTVRTNQSAIMRILSPAQQSMLARVQAAARMNASLGRAKLGGSPTYSLLAGDKYLDLLVGKLGARALRLAGKGGPAIGGVAGSMMGGPVGGGIGAAVGEGLGGDIGKSLYSASRDQIMALVKRGIQNPEFGKQLMMKAANSNAKFAGPRFRAYMTALPGILLNQRRSRNQIEAVQ